MLICFWLKKVGKTSLDRCHFDNSHQISSIEINKVITPTTHAPSCPHTIKRRTMNCRISSPLYCRRCIMSFACLIMHLPPPPENGLRSHRHFDDSYQISSIGHKTITPATNTPSCPHIMKPWITTCPSSRSMWSSRCKMLFECLIIHLPPPPGMGLRSLLRPLEVKQAILVYPWQQWVPIF